MNTPDGKVLMHGPRPYDPQKAREYYLRTRKLKGRKKGESYTVKGPSGGTQTLSGKELAKQKANTARRVGEIKERLNELTRELKKRMAEAREAERKSKKGPTAAEKAEAARESKKYRDKNRQKLKSKRGSGGGSKTSDSGPPTVDELKQKVENVRGILKAAVERQRSLSSATKNG